MANDLATLTTKLSTKLRDTSNATWTQAELNDILTWRTALLYIDRMRNVRDTVTLIDDTEQYNLTNVKEVYRVDLLDNDQELVMPLAGGTWELWANETGTDVLYVNTIYARTGWYLRVHGYAPYDLVTNLPPDRMVPLILAESAAEAARREVARRLNFKTWATSQQTANISVNELTQMVNQYEQEANRLRTDTRIIRHPKPAKVG